MLNWWTGLLTSGAAGAVVAVVLAAFAVLAAGNAVIWTLVGVKRGAIATAPVFARIGRVVTRR